ncbi:MAG: amino acid ABC transporter substrate-binding protein [Xanthobacteraceae bacterium]
MQLKTVLKFALASVVAGLLGLGSARAQDTIKIGVVGPKTGPLAGGAAVTHFPNFDLWASDVNKRGGLKLKTGQKKVELIVYDDKTNPGETIKAVERLATQDKADFIFAPYGTGFNLAAAPTFAKHGYPQFAVAAVTDQIDELIKKYPTIYFWIGDTTSYARSVAEILKKLVDEKKIGNKVAMVNVADAFGIELANAARPVFTKAGFELVYDKSYPLGTQDLAPVVKAAKAANPDSFVAWSYPPDSFGLAEQAKIEGLSVKAYYSAVATAFPAFGAKFGKSAEGILGAGGIQNTPAIQDYRKRHKEVTGVDADYWGSAIYYAALQVLEQAIEGVGSTDRKAVNDYIKSRTFQTIAGTIDQRKQSNPWFWTVGQWKDGAFHGVKGVNTKDADVSLKAGW